MCLLIATAGAGKRPAKVAVGEIMDLLRAMIRNLRAAWLLDEQRNWRNATIAGDPSFPAYTTNWRCI